MISPLVGTMPVPEVKTVRLEWVVLMENGVVVPMFTLPRDGSSIISKLPVPVFVAERVAELCARFPNAEVEREIRVCTITVRFAVHSIAARDGEGRDCGKDG